MKKNLPLLICLLLIENMFGQILNRSESWPNPAWTIIGAYTPASIISNPTTVDANFKYDSALVSPSGASTVIKLTSPTFDLKPAFDGNQRVLFINFNIAFTTLALNALFVQYWDADLSTWKTFPDGTAPIQNSGDYQNCTMDLANSAQIYLDFSGFSVNQQQNFKYRIFINGTSSQIVGTCIESPVVRSLSCQDPTNLHLIGSTLNDKVTIGWNVTGSGYMISPIAWNLQYGNHGFSLGTGNMIQYGSTPPFTLTGLTSNTQYDVYIQRDCSGGNNTILTSWVGPLTFSTTNLGLEEVKLEGLKLYPNPTKGFLEIEATNTINEIKVYNLIGQELLTKKGAASRLNLDLSTFNSGFYFLKIDTDKGTGVYKIVKE